MQIPSELITLDPDAVVKPLKQQMQGDDDGDGKEGHGGDGKGQERRRQKKVERRYLAKTKNIRDERREQILERMEKEKKRKEAQKRELLFFFFFFFLSHTHSLFILVFLLCVRMRLTPGFLHAFLLLLALGKGKKGALDRFT